MEVRGSWVMKARADQTSRKCAREHRTMAVEVAVERYLTVHHISKVFIEEVGCGTIQAR